MPASEKRIPGEDVKKLLAERGIRHYDAAKALGITPNYFSARLRRDFSAEEVERIGVIGTREEDAKPVGKTITQKDFNTRLRKDFSAEEVERIGVIGTREEDAKPVGKTITQKDFNIVVEHYRDEFISMAFSRPELLLAMGEIVDEIKTVHCRKEYVQVETWDYFDEVS